MTFSTEKHTITIDLEPPPELVLTDRPLRQPEMRLRETTAGDVPEERLRAYLEKAPEMVEYLSEHTRAEFVALPEYADYYQRVPGSRPGGRSLEPITQG